MRYLQILREAHADYDAMFLFLRKWQKDIDMSLKLKLIDHGVGVAVDYWIDKAIRRAEAEIVWARKYLKRYDVAKSCADLYYKAHEAGVG